MNSPIYVIGHVNPDTDSIASAIGYAWLIKERDGLNVIPARSGAINPQTLWILRYLDIEPPHLLNDASPKFESVARRLDTTTPDQPLREAWAIASRTGGIAPVINHDGTPFGLVTGQSLFKLMSEYVGPNLEASDLKVNAILELPSREASDTNVQKFKASTRIKDLLKKVLREEEDAFWVIDDEGKYLGIVRQRDILNPPRIKLILVDHNEPQQAIASLEEAELLEILDHHKLGNPPTNRPIRFTVEPVGSTSTLVSEQISYAGLSAPPPIAALLMAGIISDTLNLISPTTTHRDSEAIKRLERWAFSGGSKLSGETADSLAEKVLAAGTGLSARRPKEIVTGDLKQYTSGEIKFAVSQAEVSSLYELDEHIIELSKALSDLRESKGFDFTVLMVTDVVKGSSRLLIDNPPAILEDLPFEPYPDGTFLAEGMVSRKKQLIPVIMSLLEV
jgi:manganese-dependent inorganic pyrophosphatase